MSSLVICEKPSVAQDVAKALLGSTAKRVGDHWEGPDAIVAFAVGHLVEQVDPDAYDDKYKKWKYDDLPILPDAFRYQARDARAAKTLKSLHALMKRPDVDVIINACDAGREGELIFKLILETAPKAAHGKTVKRAWFSSMTQKAISDAFDVAPRRRGDAAPRGRRPGPQRGRLARRHERHPRRHHQGRLDPQGALPRPRADADPRADRQPRPRHRRLRPRGLLGGRGRLRGRRGRPVRGPLARGLDEPPRRGRARRGHRGGRLRPPGRHRVARDQAAGRAAAAALRPHDAAARGQRPLRLLGQPHPRRGPGALRPAQAPDLSAYQLALPVGRHGRPAQERRQRRGRRGARVRRPGALRARPRPPAARPRGQRRQGHRPPRDHPDRGRPRPLGPQPRRAAHLRHGRAPLPGRLPPGRALRAHGGRDPLRRAPLPLAAAR